MFLVALFMFLCMLFGYIYMLLLLNRTKVCLQSICSQVQEKGRKSERLMKETRTYDCTKIPMSRSTPKRHFIEWRSKYSWFQVPRQRKDQVWTKNQELWERYKPNIKRPSLCLQDNSIRSDATRNRFGWRWWSRPFDRTQPVSDRMEPSYFSQICTLVQF